MGVQSYNEDRSWRRINTALPLHLRIEEPHPAKEEWQRIGRFNVHVDRWDAIAARATVIMIHGAGGNGRMLGPYGKMCVELGYNAIAPDLPGYGLTSQPSKLSIRYDDWRVVLESVVRTEAARGLPIILAGLSMGGMLAYDVAAQTGIPKGLIATCLMGPTDPKARRAMVRWPWMTRFVEPLLCTFPRLTDNFPVLMKLSSNMSAITNVHELTAAIVSDRRAGGNWMPAGFLRTFLTAKSATPPEDFITCPVLLAHPAADRWTDVSVSLPFVERLRRVQTRIVMLENGGHFPVELEAHQQLQAACVSFIDDVLT